MIENIVNGHVEVRRLVHRDVERIKIVVIDQKSNKIRFCTRNHIQMIFLKREYANRTNQNMRTMRFLYEGRHIGTRDTAQSLDIIEVCQKQIGG